MSFFLESCEMLPVSKASSFAIWVSRTRALEPKSLRKAEMLAASSLLWAMFIAVIR